MVVFGHLPIAFTLTTGRPMLDSKASLTLTSANLPALLAAANVQAMDAQVNAMVQIDGATASPAELALSLVYAEQVYSADALWTLQSDISDNQASDSVFAIEQGVFFSAERRTDTTFLEETYNIYYATAYAQTVA